MKIYIGIVFFGALLLSLILLQNFAKNLMALYRTARSEDPYFFNQAIGGQLMTGWMVCVVVLLWTSFIMLKMYM